MGSFPHGSGQLHADAVIKMLITGVSDCILISQDEETAALSNAHPNYGLLVPWNSFVDKSPPSYSGRGLETGMWLGGAEPKC